MRLAAIDAGGRIASQTVEATPPGGDPDRLRATLARLSAAIDAGAWREARRVGVALPGLRSDDGRRLLRAVNLPALEGLDVHEFFAGALRKDVLIESDANAAAWAQWHALGRPARLLYLSVGTGVGGGVVLDGVLVRHTHGGAGHFGFLPVLERPTTAGAGAELASTGVAGALEDAVCRGPTDGAHWLDSAARALAAGIAQLAHIYDPAIVALGGGRVDARPELIQRVESHFAGYRSPLLTRGAQIVRAPLRSDDAGVIGAGRLAGAT